MTVISVANNKGGVGKTTTTVNLGASLAYLGKNVLLVDLDPQSSLTVYVGFNPVEFSKNTYHIMTRRATAFEVICHSPLERLDVMPASIELAAAEPEVTTAFGREFILKEQLDTLSDIYDYVIIDNMPSLGILTVNSLMASDYVIVPVEPTYLAYKGLEMINSTVAEVRRYNKSLKLLGVVLTLVDERTRHAKDITDRIRSSFPTFKSAIRRSVKFADSASAGEPIFRYAGMEFAGAKGYLDIAREIIETVDAENA